MEAIIDGVIAEIQTLTELPSSEGGLSDVLELKAIYFGDPGVIPVSLYPCATVEPDDTVPESKTTGYDTLVNRVVVSFHIDARNYFDTGADEAMGDRMLVKAASLLRLWFAKTSVRTKEGSWRSVEVEDTAYRARNRETTVAKSARTTLTVHKNYVRVS